MTARDENPRWLAALVAALPVAAAAGLVLLFPPEPLPTPGRVSSPPAAVATPGPEPELIARSR